MSQTPAPQWRALRLYNAYRLGIAALLLVLYSPAGGAAKGGPGADPFLLTGTAYVLAALVLLTLDELRLGGYHPRLELGLGIDILALGLLGFAEGGAYHNIHTLMVVNLAYAGLLLGGRESLAYAALASVWLLFLAFLDARDGGQADAAFTHSGVIGLALFAVAILARTLARRLESSQRLAEQRGVDLANETQLNRLILERTQEGVLIVDGEDRVRHANRAARQLLHCVQPPEGGRRPLAEVNPELGQALHAWRERPVEDHAGFRIERPQGLQVRIAPLADSPAGPVALFLEDEASLAGRLQQAKLAALGRLTAGIAHEIRNPLSAIAHAAELLEDAPRDAQERQMLGIIRKQVGRIDRIVEDVLALARRKQARPEAIALKPWLADVLDQYRRLHAGQGMHIELVAEDGITIHADAGQLERILTILLDNALMHGRKPRGEAWVRIELKAGGPSQNVQLEVIDQGPGVPADARERLFEPFFSTHPQGHGLGLFLARELAQANRLGLYYQPGVEGGSRFIISFPR